MSTRPEDSPSQPSLVGAVVDGRYRVDAVLGEGAAGVVYRATDLEDGRDVALKHWRMHAGNDEVAGRFAREAKALDTLKHDNIVEVHGFGFLDGFPYVAMELLEGRTLEAVLEASESLEPALAFEIARQMLDAIAYAHDQDVVHRDLKPENIFVARDDAGRPRVKILDYGLAKFMAEGSDPTGGALLTVQGMMLGTPAYMPPEQAVGSSVDVQADVYSAGCVLFELLTGRPPYLEDSIIGFVKAHMTAPIPRIEEARPELKAAPELQAIIDRAMAKRQIDRYANAGEMLAALERLPQPALVHADALPAAPDISDMSSNAEARGEARRGNTALMVAGVMLLLVALIWLLR